MAGARRGERSTLRAVGTCGLVALAIGAMGGLGWILSSETLLTVRPGLYSMKVNTAITIVVAGGALLLHARRKSARIVAGLGGFVALVGVLTSLQWAAGMDLGIDELLARDDPTAVGGLSRGRMAPHTSVSFTLLGVGLMALERPRLRAAIEIMALCATLLGYLAILGYLYHAPELYALGPHVAIALHTAGALIALGIGVSLALPDGRLARALTEEGPPGLLTRRLLPAAVLGPLLVGVIRSVGEHLRLYEKDTGTGIATLACTMIGVAMIWWSAGAMRRLDERRAEAMRRLEEAADSSARAAHELEVSAREKEVLLKEVHHRVKNNLQVIASLLYLQGRHARDEELAGLLMESRDRVYSMALIHEKLYGSHSLAQIDFGDYLATLTRALSSSLGIEPARVEIETQAGGVLLDVEAAMPCALIVNELVTNSLKHAFPGQCRGHIRVSFQKASPERWELAVSDNGVGLPADFDPRRASTLGMQLVCSLTEQLRGTLELVPKDGTHVRIRFESQASC